VSTVSIVRAFQAEQPRSLPSGECTIRGGLLRRALAGAVVAILCWSGSALPAAAAPETALVSSCSDGSVSWRADYALQTTGFGPLVRVNALTKIVGDEQVDAASMTWEWRLDDFAYPFRAARGPLKTSRSAKWQGREWQSIFRSPRIVAPDGACQIYLAPFTNRRGSSSWRCSATAWWGR
jgi:hypothetical protein